MEMFSEKFGSQITAASFMRFTLYLKTTTLGGVKKSRLMKPVNLRCG